MNELIQELRDCADQLERCEKHFGPLAEAARLLAFSFSSKDKVKLNSVQRSRLEALLGIFSDIERDANPEQP